MKALQAKAIAEKLLANSKKASQAVQMAKRRIDKLNEDAVKVASQGKAKMEIDYSFPIEVLDAMKFLVSFSSNHIGISWNNEPSFFEWLRWRAAKMFGWNHQLSAIDLFYITARSKQEVPLSVWRAISYATKKGKLETACVAPLSNKAKNYLGTLGYRIYHTTYGVRISWNGEQ